MSADPQNSGQTFSLPDVDASAVKSEEASEQPDVTGDESKPTCLGWRAYKVSAEEARSDRIGTWQTSKAPRIVPNHVGMHLYTTLEMALRYALGPCLVRAQLRGELRACHETEMVGRSLCVLETAYIEDWQHRIALDLTYKAMGQLSTEILTPEMRVLLKCKEEWLQGTCPPMQLRRAQDTVSKEWTKNTRYDDSDDPVLYHTFGMMVACMRVPSHGALGGVLQHERASLVAGATGRQSV